MNVPLLAPEGPDQEPPGAGVPPNKGNRLNCASVEHRVTVVLVPAFGALFTATVTVAEAFAQGGTPTTM